MGRIESDLVVGHCPGVGTPDLFVHNNIQWHNKNESWDTVIDYMEDTSGTNFKLHVFYILGFTCLHNHSVVDILREIKWLVKF